MARLSLILAGLWLVATGLALTAQSAGLESSFFEGRMHPAIAYQVRPSNDAVARLDAALASGATRLEFDPRSGYLRSVLKALEVDIDSQIAVFSKTSLQSALIEPGNPRTIFFNDQVAVAWPRGGFIEIAAQDREQGVGFYMLQQREAQAPRFERPQNCVVCHVSYATLNVPGLLMRSVATADDGSTMTYLANATPDHRTPFEDRWGGWFVTGDTGRIRHLGNGTIAASRRRDADAAAVATPAATPLPLLPARLEQAGYLSRHSDVAAHLVFAHQVHMMNLLTRVGWQTRAAVADHEPDAARTIATAATEFVDYLLFVDETPLPAPVKGASGFAERFSALGPRDHAGRSLRELDLRTRILKYPCSYLIYSPAFEGLPPEAKSAIYQRLWQVLSGAETAPRYRKLTADDRRAVVEILRDTKADLPEFFGR